MFSHERPPQLRLPVTSRVVAARLPRSKQVGAEQCVLIESISNPARKLEELQAVTITIEIGAKRRKRIAFEQIWQEAHQAPRDRLLRESLSVSLLG